MILSISLSCLFSWRDYSHVVLTFKDYSSFSLPLLYAATLPYLFQTTFQLDEGLAPVVLQLVQVALSGVPPKVVEKEPAKREGGGRRGGKHESRKEAKESKEQSKEMKESKTATPAPRKLTTDISLI